jgi:hypothetical protein
MRPTVKVMSSVFWDHKGILLIEIMRQYITNKAVTYYATLTRLRMAIKGKLTGLPRKVICFCTTMRGRTLPWTPNNICNVSSGRMEHPGLTCQLTIAILYQR